MFGESQIGECELGGMVNAGVTDHRKTVVCLKVDKIVKTVHKSINHKK